eukprot:TRINITY_DN24807_c0_g1_i1.p1 TRINITY_DN24807_c0_g1~~TRINITY_DN24807_c0_g1_i1.p1  ORF type:complete len:251 (+),score=37.20 TRINITY_DN24807_c0_g1_i1:75-827(+)
MVCGGCFSWLRPGSEKKPSEEPVYRGAVKRKEVDFGTDVGRLLVETWPDGGIGGSLWPSGMLLGRALAEVAAATSAAGQCGARRKMLEALPVVKDLQVAELGAGPGVPGLVAGRLGARCVAITDREDLVPLISQNISLNGLDGVCSAEPLDWPHARTSPLAASKRVEGPLDVVLAADVVYFEEQDPLIDAFEALMKPRHTTLVLAYRERTDADRRYLEDCILPKLHEPTRIDYSWEENGSCEIYVGTLRK